MVNNYETLLLLSPELAEDGRNGIIENLSDIVAKGDGKISEVDEWGIRTLAYPVRKQTRGYYVRLVYNAPGELVTELERNIRISDDIYKFVTVKLADNTTQEA